MNRSASLQAADSGSQALLRGDYGRDFYPQLDQNRLVAALGEGNVVSRKPIPAQFATMRLVPVGERAVDPHIFPSDAFDIEAALEGFPNLGAVECRKPPNGIDGLGHVLDEVAGHAIVDDFRRRTAPESDHGSAAGHGFNHDQPKGLRPVYRK